MHEATACGPPAAEARTGARESMKKLVCAECGRRAPEDARGWRALIGHDPEHKLGPQTVYVFCPECAEREFGPPH